MEPSSLTDDEQDAWVSLAATLIRLPAALDARLRRDAGLSTFDYLVLSGLFDAPDNTLRMSELATLANGSLSRLSHVVTRLEGRGWVRRKVCPTDGRCTNAVLTRAGRAKLTAAAPAHAAAVRTLVLDALTAGQMRHLRDIGRRILRHLDPDEPCLNGPAHHARRTGTAARRNQLRVEVGT